MPTPSKLKAIEQREGRPMADILHEMYEKHGKQKKVAEALGVGAATVSQWLAVLGLREKTIVVPREKAS